MYDIAIIGGGPAGSTVARYLSKKGQNVCLIDRMHFPRNKPCGGGFSYRMIEEFPWLKETAKDFLQGICRVGVMHSPNGRITLKSRIDMAVALRTDFDNAIFQAAVDEGTDVICGQRVKSISFPDDSVKVSTNKGETFEARALVGADGVTSLVARATKLRIKWPTQSVTPCNVAEIPMRERDILDLYTEDRHYHFFANVGGRPGYGWIFPKRETVNVGLGMLGKHAKGLPRYFKAFIRRLQRDELLLPNSNTSSVIGGIVPTSGPIGKTYTDRCLLVGDSAGMVNPLTGGGIHYAMKAGKIAAHVLSNALAEDKLDAEYLALYQKLWQADFGHEIKPLILAQKVFTSPFTNVLFEIGNRDLKIQQVVSDALSEASRTSIDVKLLAARSLAVILKSAFRLP